MKAYYTYIALVVIIVLNSCSMATAILNNKSLSALAAVVVLMALVLGILLWTNPKNNHHMDH